MKKILLCALPIMGILFSACQQVELSNELENLDPTDIVYATIEDPADTRTYLDGEKILWSSGDEIVAFMGKTLRRKYVVSIESVGTSEGSFVRDTEYEHIGSSSPISHNVAFYPFAELICKADGEIYVLEGLSLPSVQTYVPDSFGPNVFSMLAVSADTDDVDFRFKNLCGVLQLQLQGDGTIASITLKGNSDEILAGLASMTMSHGGIPAISLASDGLKEVTLDCGKGVELNSDAPTSFFISLPPVPFSNGFTITVTDTQGRTEEYSTTKQNPILRSTILRMPVKEYTAERQSQEGDYIDEYGVNHGPGVKIGETVWAPVNCGFHSTDYQYGKLYQWGRKFGQGYSGNFYGEAGNMTAYSDATIPSIEYGGISSNLGKDKSKSNIFYRGSFDWAAPPDPTLWNVGTEDNPVKTEYDPCPDGWRVPTCAEMSELAQHFSSSMTNDMGQKGCWLSGPVEYSESVPSVFFPMAGHLESDGDAVQRGRKFKYWTSLAEGIQSYCFDWYLTLSKSFSSRAIGASVRCVQNDSESAVSESIMISHKYLKLVVGESEKLSVEVSSSSMEQPVPIWSSDDTSVIIVDADGVVTAVSEGTATITVVVGQMEARCEVAVIQMIDYIDEYDVNQGKGIKIGSTVWAPVNCGYHQTKYKYGRLFQWGRKYGQGYAGQIYVDGMVSDYYYDSTYPKLLSGAVTIELGNSEANSNVFYKASSDNVYDWANPYDDTLWNGGTEDNPVKTEYDPCPDGWRIPTYAELLDLTELCSWGQNSDGQTGGWFSRPVNGESDQSVLFLPAAGRYFVSGKCDERGLEGHYWSSRTSYRDACGLNFEKNSVYLRGIMPRATAMSVRCVQVTDEAAEL